MESSCIVPEDTPKQTPEHSKVEPPSLEIYIEIEGGAGVEESSCIVNFKIVVLRS